MNDNATTQAKRIVDKLYGVHCPLAVFVRLGSVSSTRVTSKLFRTVLNKYQQTLVEVYTIDVRVEDLAKDLELMGVK